LTVGILALPGSLLHRPDIQTTRQKHQAPLRCRGRFETAEDHGIRRDRAILEFTFVVRQRLGFVVQQLGAAGT